MRTFQTKLAIVGLMGAVLAFGACAPKHEAAQLDQRISNYLSGFYDSVQDQSAQKAMVTATQMAASVTVSAVTAPTDLASLGTTLSSVTTAGSASGSLAKAPAAGSGTLATAPSAGSGSPRSAPASGTGSLPSGTVVGGGAGLASAPAGGGSGSAADYGAAICNFVQGFVTYLSKCSTGNNAAITAAFQSINCSSYVTTYLSTATIQSVPAAIVTQLNCIGTTLQNASCTDVNTSFSACGSGT